MSETRGKARHRRRKTALAVGVPLALTAAGVTAYGFLPGTQSPASAATTAAPAWATATADGFASVNALGQNGTYGGRDGQIVTVKTLADLEKYATAAEPYVIVVAATINMNPVGKEIKVQSNKTIVGSGTSGHIVGGGFFLGSGVHNVIIRNLTIRDAYQGIWNDKEHDFDAIQMDGAHHVWIDHNDLRHMADGLIDVRKDSTYVTVSWNKLSQDNKAFGIGWTENVVTDITIHHNWIRETEQRNPSTDNAAHAHLYNNFLEDVADTDIKSSYGNYSRGATKMVLENSYFQGVNNPVIKDSTATIVQKGNTFVGTSGRNESGVRPSTRRRTTATPSTRPPMCRVCSSPVWGRAVPSVRRPPRPPPPRPPPSPSPRTAPGSTRPCRPRSTPYPPTTPPAWSSPSSPARTARP